MKTQMADHFRARGDGCSVRDGFIRQSLASWRSCLEDAPILPAVAADPIGLCTLALGRSKDDPLMSCARCRKASLSAQSEHARIRPRSPASLCFAWAGVSRRRRATPPSARSPPPTGDHVRASASWPARSNTLARSAARAKGVWLRGRLPTLRHRGAFGSRAILAGVPPNGRSGTGAHASQWAGQVRRRPMAAQS